MATPAWGEDSELNTLSDSSFGAGAVLGVETYGQDLGLGWSRVPLDINESNYNDTQYIRSQGQYIGRLQAKGIMPLVIINPRKQNQWLSAEQYGQAVAAVVESFDKDGNGDAEGLLYPVYTYELINEYSSQGGLDYSGLSQSSFVSMFAAGMESARQACTDCQIAYDPFNESDAQALLQQVNADQIDIISYHTYSPLDYPESFSSDSYFTNFSDMLNRLGLDDKPVWVTEYACYDHQGMTPPPDYCAAGDQNDHARWLVQTAVWGLGSNFFQKNLYGNRTAPGRAE